MTSTILLWWAVGCILVGAAFNAWVEWLNFRHAPAEVPAVFRDRCSQETYDKSRRYLHERMRWGLLQSIVSAIITVAFILCGGFAYVHALVSSFEFGPLTRGIIFFGVLAVASYLLGLPFSIHRTFGIEQRYGFNRTTPRTFILDQLRVALLGIVLGIPLLYVVLWFFTRGGSWAWLYAWAIVSAFQLFVIFIAPVTIMPLFNKYFPLPDGPLKDALLSYATKMSFQMKGLYQSDGSRRSTKANAFFTGFGRFRRVVLFDTLIEKHTINELVAIFAHEVGHERHRHVLKHLVLGIVTSGVMFFLLSILLAEPSLYRAFGIDAPSDSLPVYAGLVFFGLVYAPIGSVLGIVQHAISRRHEYQADAFAAHTTGDAQALIDGLKKLSVDTLSDLCPHPLKVAFSYSHPPVTARISALSSLR